uniref:Secreted protein n=1 Tax=Knipowitschia caucasica TaxID=637954 RepID=A0AAV2LX37_KNICA
MVPLLLVFSVSLQVSDSEIPRGLSVKCCGVSEGSRRHLTSGIISEKGPNWIGRRMLAGGPLRQGKSKTSLQSIINVKYPLYWYESSLGPLHPETLSISRLANR